MSASQCQAPTYPKRVDLRAAAKRGSQQDPKGAALPAACPPLDGGGPAAAAPCARGSGSGGNRAQEKREMDEQSSQSVSRAI